MDNPYQSPESFQVTPKRSVRRRYGGIQRFPFFVINVGLEIAHGTIYFMVLSTAQANGRVPNAFGALMVVSIFFLASALVTVYYRLINIGMKPLWCLLMFVPFANLFITVRCLVCQEGYADTQELDGPAKLMAGIFVCLVVLIVLSLVLSVLGSTEGFA